MFAAFSFIPNWSSITPMELAVWIIAMGLATLFGICAVVAFTQEKPAENGRQFRGAFQLLATVMLLMIGSRIASHGHETKTVVRTQTIVQERCSVVDKNLFRSVP